MAFNTTQQITLAIIPKISAFLSICGSLCIIRDIVILDPRKLRRVYHRLLLVMSIYDVIESAFNFQSSWPIPKGTQGVAFAIGNTKWCEAQGFILQFGVVIPILNCGLSIYYLLVIKYSWTEEQIRRYAEPLFHIVSLAVALITSSLGIRYDLFNNSNLWCWYAPLPPGCKDSYTYGKEEANCIRGDNAWIYRWGAYYAPLWASIFGVMCSMVILYKTVLDLEKVNNQILRRGSASIPTSAIESSSNGHQSRRRNSASISSLFQTSKRGAIDDNNADKLPESRSRRVMAQALWYVGAFYVTFTFATINRLIQQLANKTYFGIIVAHSIFEPGQGVCNYIVYLRPRFLRHRAEHPELPLIEIVKLTLGFTPSEKLHHFVDKEQEDEEMARQEAAKARRWVNKRNIFVKIVNEASKRAGNGPTATNNNNNNNIDDVKTIRQKGNEIKKNRSRMGKPNRFASDEHGSFSEERLSGFEANYSSELDPTMLMHRVEGPIQEEEGEASLSDDSDDFNGHDSRLYDESDSSNEFERFTTNNNGIKK